jgi:ABC-2 type transport system permease protein
MNAIYVLWIRQLKRYVRSHARLVGALGQPLMFLIALGYGFGAIYRRAGEGNYIHFLVPGVIAQTILFTAVFSGSEVIWDRQFGFLKETLVAPVSRLQIMIGRTLGGATVAVIQGVLVMVICLIAGFRPAHFFAIPLALGFMVLIALLFASLGMAIGSGLQDMQGFQLIMNFLVLPIYFLSGALFPLTGQGRIMSYVTKADPLAYGIDGMRNVLGSPLAAFDPRIDFLVLVVVGCVLLVFGAHRFNRIEI